MTTDSYPYPTLRPSEGLDYLHALKQQWTPGDTPEVVVERSGAPLSKGLSPHEFDEALVLNLQAELRALSAQFPSNVSAVRGSRNDFDLEASRVIYSRLKVLPVEILFDKDFWRYLSVHVLFEVLIWRIPDSGKESWPSNFGVGSNWTRCYPYKAYLRGQLVEEIKEAGMPWEEVRDVDFFDSHLFGRRNGLIPPVASALNSIRMTVRTSRQLDPFARTASRYRSAHVTELLAPHEAEELLRRYTQVPAES